MRYHYGIHLAVIVIPLTAPCIPLLAMRLAVIGNHHTAIAITLAVTDTLLIVFPMTWMRYHYGIHLAVIVIPLTATYTPLNVTGIPLVEEDPNVPQQCVSMRQTEIHCTHLTHMHPLIISKQLPSNGAYTLYYR
jgi:hypothetical protein